MMDFILTDFSAPETKEKIAKSQISIKDVMMEAKTDIEKDLIAIALEVFGWNRRSVARSLDMSYRSLLYKITQYGLTGKPPRKQPWSRKTIRRDKEMQIKPNNRLMIGRRTIPEMVRNFILKRDGFKCVSCGDGTISQLVIDHICPFSKNGDTEIENLQTLCKQCNRDKFDKVD